MTLYRILCRNDFLSDRLSSGDMGCFDLMLVLLAEMVSDEVCVQSQTCICIKLSVRSCFKWLNVHVYALSDFSVKCWADCSRFMTPGLLVTTWIRSMDN